MTPLLVGADWEDSNATGVNGNASDNSAPQSGAAYVFTLPAIGPHLTIRRDGSGGCLIRCQGFPGWSYRLQRALGVTGPWERPGSPQTAPASGLVEFSVPFIPFPPPPRQAFYRVVSP